ncbi:HNH endonuclease [Cupriavidus metallidurans]
MGGEPRHANCALCLAVLNNKSQSKEHIIPNSIGGRRKAGAFICKTCNNKLGETWDAELAKQLNWCALSVGVCRERGEVPKQIVQTIDGRRLWLNNDGTMTPEKPSYNERLVDGQTEISFTARDRREAARMIEGVKRKHPGFNEKKAHNQLEVQHTYLDSPIHMTLGFGGPSAGRSVVKTAWAHASDVGLPNWRCDEAKKYLTDEGYPPPYGFAYKTDFVLNRPADKVFHCVSLMGDPKTGLLLSYIEYFGLFRMLVRLSATYAGASVHETYAIDPTTGSALKLDIDWSVSGEEIGAILDGDGYTKQGYLAAMNHTMPLLLRRNDERHMSRAVREAFDYAAQSLGIDEGDIIPPDVWPAFVDAMMEKLDPFIHHLVLRSLPQQPVS